MTKTRKCYTDVSESLGFGMSTLQRWVAQYKQEQQGIKPKTGNALTKEQREIQRLRKQVQQLTLERDILIKVIKVMYMSPNSSKEAGKTTLKSTFMFSL